MLHAREVEKPADGGRRDRQRETYVARRSLAGLGQGTRSAARRVWQARWTLRVISVTAAAAGASWAACIPLGTIASAFGAASAVYAVQLTVRTSVLDGAKRTALMALSVLLGAVILKTVGLSVWAVMAVVFLSLSVGSVLRLGMGGSLQIPGTAIFILALGSSVTTSELLARVWATLIGAVIGAAASMLAYPGDPVARARHSIAHLAGAIGGLLGDMSAGLGRRPNPTLAGHWLARSRVLDDELEQTRPLVDEAVAFLQLDPFGRRSDANELSRLLRALDHSVSQLRGIARTLFDHQVEEQPGPLPPGLAQLLGRTARAYRAQAEALEGEAPKLDVALEAVREARRQSLKDLRRVDDTGAWVVSGAILTDVDRMISQLEGDSPALEVAEPRPPRWPGRGSRRRSTPKRQTRNESR